MAITNIGSTPRSAWGASLSPVADKPIWDTLTFRRFVYAMIVVVALGAIFNILALAESSVTGRTAVIDRPFAVAMVCFGLAHFIIALVFMVSSRAMRNAVSPTIFRPTNISRKNVGLVAWHEIEAAKLAERARYR